MVRVEGLEPTRLAALDPKSSVSTNFTTPAQSERGAKVGIRIFRWNLQAMNFGCPFQNRLRALFLGLAGAVAVVASAQESEPIRIQILQADAILRDRSQPDVQRLIGGVLLGMEDSRLRCDSAWRYDDGTFRTMGNVQLTDGPQTLRADEMELNPETQWVRAKSDADRRVQLDAEAGQLTCTVLRYHLKREVALLPSGGRLQDDGRSVEFQHGQYQAKTALLMLGGSVHMDNADYTLDSDSLHWREEVDEFSFHGPSHLRTTDERFELRCSSGEFDVETESGWFGGAGAPGVELRNDEVWLEADSVHLPPDTLLPATAVGEVDITDTLELWTLSGHYAERLERGEEFDVWVAGKPERRACWVDAGEEDTLKLVADTISVMGGLTTVWPAVELSQGDASASCDTLIWNTDADRVQLLRRPKMWMEGWLLQSDSLEWAVVENRPESLRAAGHASLMMPIDSGACYQQIAGREITGRFVSNALEAVWVNGNAQSVYFDSEADAPCAEFNQSLCSKMRMDFDEGEVKRIVLLDRPEGQWKSGDADAPVLEGLNWVNAPEVKRE